MLTASTSLWYLYAPVVYFTLCKLLSRWKLPVLGLLALASIAINFLPLPWWGMNSVVRNMIYYSLGAWYGAELMARMKGLNLRRTGWRWPLLLRSPWYCGLLTFRCCFPCCRSC